MAEPRPVDDAIALLREKREYHLRAAKEAGEGIAALEKLSARAPDEPARPRPSVRTMVTELLNEEPRDWSAGEIIAEYRRRGRPVHGKDPSNALRAALADAKARGMIVSTGTGRYKAAKWKQPAVPSDPSTNGAGGGSFDKEVPMGTS